MQIGRRTLLHTFALVAALVGVTGVAARAQHSTPRNPSVTEDDHLRVWLLTAGPGDEVWERFGHNALRVLDTRAGRDVSYNWGIFDFRQADFISRFLQGRMLYQMAPFDTDAMVDLYARANREVVQQELDLTPEQKRELYALAEINALPENRGYIYQYFLDNCSTRIRDLLDQVLDGGLSEAFAGILNHRSYRDHSRRLTQMDPLIFTGQDFLLGAPTDAALSVWEEMFLPLTLRDELRGLTIRGDTGRPRPFVLTEEVLVAADRPGEPETPPRWLFIYLTLGLILGGALSGVGRTRGRYSAWLHRSLVTVAVTWSLVGGGLGSVLVLLLFTDHTFSYWNENLFLFNPLMLVLGVLLPFTGLGSRWEARARGLAIALAGIAVVGLLWQLAPASRHQNAIFFALALPVHLGLAGGLSVFRDKNQR